MIRRTQASRSVGVDHSAPVRLAHSPPSSPGDHEGECKVVVPRKQSAAREGDTLVPSRLFRLPKVLRRSGKSPMKHTLSTTSGKTRLCFPSQRTMLLLRDDQIRTAPSMVVFDSNNSKSTTFIRKNTRHLFSRSIYRQRQSLRWTLQALCRSCSSKGRARENHPI